MGNAIYSNGIAKAQFNKLLGISRLNRMIESSPEDAIKILSEVNFGDGVIIDSPLDFEKILYSEERKLLSFVRQNSPNDTFGDFFLLPYDFHNGEALIKAKHLKVDGEKMLVPHGKFESSFMSEKISADDYRSFPKSMKEALLSCDLLFVNNKATGENISSVMRKSLYAELEKISKKDKILSEIFAFKVDMQNVSSALRIKNFQVLKEMFLTGGKISINEIKTLCEQSIDNIKERIKFYSNGDVIKIAIDSIEQNKPFSDFERIVDSFPVSLLKKQKYSTEGIIPFMLYCYYKLNEINNVRIVMVGLINGIDKANIVGRMRDCYEG